MRANTPAMKGHVKDNSFEGPSGGGEGVVVVPLSVTTKNIVDKSAP